MGLFSKLAFWRRSEEPLAPPKLPSLEPLPPPRPPSLEHLGPEPGLPLESMPPLHAPGLGSEPSPHALEPVPAAPLKPSLLPASNEHQLIVSKLDTIKAQLDAVLSRLERIEHERPYQRRWS